MKITKKILFLIIPIAFVISIFFIISQQSDANSTYTRVDDIEDSDEIKKLRGIPEVEEFLSKNVENNMMMGVSTGPFSITIHASGGFTGQTLTIYYFSEEPSGITLGCWTDYGAKKEFSSDVLEHIKNNSCEDI